MILLDWDFLLGLCLPRLLDLGLTDLSGVVFVSSFFGTLSSLFGDSGADLVRFEDRNSSEPGVLPDSKKSILRASGDF